MCTIIVQLLRIQNLRGIFFLHVAFSRSNAMTSVRETAKAVHFFLSLEILHFSDRRVEALIEQQTKPKQACAASA